MLARSCLKRSAFNSCPGKAFCVDSWKVRAASATLIALNKPLTSTERDRCNSRGPTLLWSLFMFLSQLQKNRKPSRSAGYRPSVEALDQRIVPASAHFVSGGTSSLVDAATGALTVNFHEAGLGNSVSVDDTLTANANATYQWLNHGGNRPMGVPFNVNQTISVSGT